MGKGKKVVFAGRMAIPVLTALLFVFGCGVLAAQDEGTAPNRPLRTRVNVWPDYPAEKNSLLPFRLSSAPSLLNPVSLERDLTQHYINYYSSQSGLEQLDAAMRRAAPYIEFIRKEIEARNLPIELLYLPVIESQFHAGALSRSGASGLWQFMRNSIAPYMKINDWVDERRDFWKSTQGALSKLEENYRHFGDWPLALAAYNAGLGAISRIVKDTGINDYWALCERKVLKTETIHYVPKLFAVSYILSNPRRFGLSPNWAEDPQWTRLVVDRPIDLNMLAEEAGIDAHFLRLGNMELNYNVTPPGPGHLIKVRSVDAESIAAVLSRNDLPLVRHYVHTIRSGDTLLALALHYGISVEQILQSNPGTNERFLKIGANLVIPALRETSPYISALPTDLNFGGTYVVRKGDTLWSIARSFGIAPEALAEANGMGMNDILREGRTIKTPIR